MKQMNKKEIAFYNEYLSNCENVSIFERNKVRIENNTLYMGKDYIISGNIHFIGSDEKRRNNEIVHISFPYNHANYCLFYKGCNDILKKVCWAINELLTNDHITRNQQEILYKALIESLYIVHHRNTEKIGKDGKKHKRNSKLDGINSLSTCCLDCLFCIARMKDVNSICFHCYAGTQQKTQLALQDRNTINGIILRNVIIPSWAWKKYINPADLSKFFRIESFGDTANHTQAINYLNFVNAFKRVHFAIWSKNIGLWAIVFSQNEKPHNLSYVHSCNKVNCCEIARIKKYDFVDHIFTVFDKKFIDLHNINITCGGKSCMKDCIRKGIGCYYPKSEGKEITQQNELLK